MRVAVMGAGGTGGWFGGLLARAGEDVTFIARGTHLAALRADGLSVRSHSDGGFALPVKATDNPREIGPVDLILFAVKDYDTDEAARQILPLIGPETMLLSTQNGIDNEGRIGRIVGERAVIGAVALISARIDAPGVIANPSGQGQLIFGELAGGTSPRTERLLAMFQRAGIPSELSADIRVNLWRKFAFICAVSGVTALTRLPLGPILTCPESAAFFRQTLEEVEAIARAGGVPLSGGYEGFRASPLGKAPDVRGSMAHDLAAGKRLELETLNGTVVRLGREHGVPAPANAAIYAALKPYADGPPPLP